GLVFEGEYFRWAGARDRSPHRWDRLSTGDPPVVSYWYRQAPRALVPSRDSSVVGWTNPPWEVSGMTGVRVDFSGRLVEFYAIPPQLEEASGPAPEPDWAPLFAEAGLDPARFTAVAPAWTPPFYCDRRQAWEGAYARRPEIPLRIEAASYRGLPVSFRLVSPWTRPERMQPDALDGVRTAREVVTTALMFLLFAVGGALAWRNLRLGRGDRRGAARLAAAIFAMGLAIWALESHRVRERDGFMTLLGREAGSSLLFAGVLWVFYLALEPYVRRFWPRTIISWTRLLAGGPRDPAVARDVLFGMIWGGAIAVVLFGTQALSPRLGYPEPVPFGGSSLRLALSLRYTAATLLALWFNGLVLAMGSLLLLLMLKLAVRRERLAAWLLVAVLTLVQALGFAGDGSPWLAAGLGFVIMASFTLLLRHAGAVACITGVVAANLLLSCPLTLDFEAWYGASALLVLAVMAALTAYAVRTATQAGRAA
ncbi:MAG TPA: hypothetical protein VF310_08590, partial [Vicinamibacteria bacterium]